MPGGNREALLGRGAGKLQSSSVPGVPESDFDGQ
jgi:hypothetical protein